jgi:hypothetical protein
MEEMTEVDLDGKKYVWDGQGWCDARTYMEPPENITSRLGSALAMVDLLCLGGAPVTFNPTGVQLLIIHFGGSGYASCTSWNNWR